jgi:hypothetical protein
MMSRAIANDMELHKIDIEQAFLQADKLGFKSEGFDTIGFEQSVWVRPAGGKYSEDIYVSAHVDNCLLSCKSLTVMAEFNRVCGARTTRL